MTTGYLPVTFDPNDFHPDRTATMHRWSPDHRHRTACGRFVNWTVSIFSNVETGTCQDCTPEEDR